MFDRYFINQSPSVVAVHEHRAPTDESVQLLREMEREAKANIVNAYAVNNIFKASVLETRPVLATEELEAFAVFTLNDEVFKIKVSVDVANSLRRGDTLAAMKVLFRALSEEIAEKLVVRLAGQIGR